MLEDRFCGNVTVIPHSREPLIPPSPHRGEGVICCAPLTNASVDVLEEFGLAFDVGELPLPSGERASPRLLNISAVVSIA